MSSDLGMWEWIDRPLDDEFFEIAGKLDKEENQRRANEIPGLLRPLVHVIIALTCKNKEMMGSGGPCILFRHELFAVYKELLKKGIDIRLPYAWFCDGVMVEPEWIVRITNGIVGWSCDPDYDNPDTCGLEDCRYRGHFPPGEPCLHPEDKIVFVNEDVATLLLLDEGVYCKDCKKKVPCPHLKDCLSQDDNGLTFNCEELISMGVCHLEKKKEIPPEEVMTDRFQLQIDKYDDMIKLLKEIQAMCEPPTEEPGIYLDILKASRRDGAAHYSTEDGQQYLVTFIGLKETAYNGPDPSPEEPDTATTEQLIERGLVCPTCGHDITWHKCELCGCFQKGLRYKSEAPAEEPEDEAPVDSAARAKWILDHAEEPKKEEE